jgi:hypothetical protein
LQKATNDVDMKAIKDVVDAHFADTRLHTRAFLIVGGASARVTFICVLFCVAP